MEEILHRLIDGLYWSIPLFLGFQTSKAMQDFFHPQHVGQICVIPRILADVQMTQDEYALR